MTTSPGLTAQYQKIQDVLDRNGNRCSPEEFRQIVNVVFHRYESAQYDEIHRCMWQSLPVIFDLLSRTALSTVKPHARLLDVGCGTGLSTSLLLNTPVGSRISAGVFIDTSEEMIQIAKRRSRHWALSSRFAISTIADLADTFDIILVSSVMHHIPDLGMFLKDVTDHLAPGGMFLHLQDPHGDANRNVVEARKQTLVQHTQGSELSLWERIRRRLRAQDRYIRETNRELLRMQLISYPLSDDEIWSITDIHDDGKGISLKEMSRALEAKLTQRQTASYAFFGRLASDLPEALRPVETSLLEGRDMDGTIMCGAWHKS